jgi:hypothetical protein
LLLLGCVALFVPFSFLPNLWRHVERDMQYLREGTVSSEGQQASVWHNLVAIAWLLFGLWFFHTPAGQSFLKDRKLAGAAAALPLTEARLGVPVYIALVVALFALTGWLASLIERAEAVAKRIERTQAFPRPALLELWAGGGVFYRVREDSSVQRDQPAAELILTPVVVLALQLCYWRWSVASVVLMFALVTAAVVADALRVLFVYIHHKRVFG